MRDFLEESNKARLADLKERNHSGEKHGNYYGTTERFQPSRSSTAMPHMSSVKPSIGLRTTEFHGTSSWMDYSVQFEMVAELNLWDNREKALFLASSLRGTARSVLGDLDRSLRYDYIALTNALDRFGSENKSELNKTLLKNRRKTEGESLPELAQALRRLSKLAYPDAPFEVQDSLAKDQFLDAVDSNLRWNVFQARPRTLDEALEVAVDCDAFHKAENQKNGFQNATKHVRAVSKDTDCENNTELRTELLFKKILEKLESKSNTDSQPRHVYQHAQNQNRQGANHGNKPPVKCWNCGEAGHIKRYCNKPAQIMRPPVQYSGTNVAANTFIPNHVQTVKQGQQPQSNQYTTGQTKQSLQTVMPSNGIYQPPQYNQMTNGSVPQYQTNSTFVPSHSDN